MHAEVWHPMTLKAWLRKTLISRYLDVQGWEYTVLERETGRAQGPAAQDARHGKLAQHVWGSWALSTPAWW